MQFDDFRIKNDSSNTKLETKKYNSNDDCVQRCNDLENCGGFTRNNKKCHFYSGTLYPNDGLEYKKNRSTFIRERINNTVCGSKDKDRKEYFLDRKDAFALDR